MDEASVMVLLSVAHVDVPLADLNTETSPLEVRTARNASVPLFASFSETMESLAVIAAVLRVFQVLSRYLVTTVVLFLR